MKKFSFLLVSIFVLINFANSQNAINLLNGKTFDAINYKLDTSMNLLQFEFNKNNKTKSKLIDIDQVYSITPANNSEIILYKANNDAQYSVFEMGYIVKGTTAAYNNYKPIWPFIAGFAVGYGSTFIPTSPIISFSVPIVYNIGIAFVKPCNSYFAKHYPEYASDELFINGFNQRAKNKILKRSIFGSLAGIVSGIATSFIVSKVGANN